jgi:hypothetical protein
MVSIWSMMNCTFRCTRSIASLRQGSVRLRGLARVALTPAGAMLTQAYEVDLVAVRILYVALFGVSGALSPVER